MTKIKKCKMINCQKLQKRCFFTRLNSANSWSRLLSSFERRETAFANFCTIGKFEFWIENFKNSSYEHRQRAFAFCIGLKVKLKSPTNTSEKRISWKRQITFFIKKTDLVPFIIVFSHQRPRIRSFLARGWAEQETEYSSHFNNFLKTDWFQRCPAISVKPTISGPAGRGRPTSPLWAHF